MCQVIKLKCERPYLWHNKCVKLLNLNVCLTKSPYKMKDHTSGTIEWVVSRFTVDVTLDAFLLL